MTVIFLNRRLHLVLGIVGLLGVFVGSVVSSPFPDNALVPESDKLIHAIAYGTLTLWFAQLIVRHNYIYLALGLFCYGAMIEWVQGELSYRTASAPDLLANGIGILIAICICVAFEKLFA